MITDLPLSKKIQRKCVIWALGQEDSQDGSHEMPFQKTICQRGEVMHMVCFFQVGSNILRGNYRMQESASQCFNRQIRQAYIRSVRLLHIVCAGYERPSTCDTISIIQAFCTAMRRAQKLARYTLSNFLSHSNSDDTSICLATRRQSWCEDFSKL